MDIKKIKSVHIIGIGGCASSAIAELLCDNGIKVSGSEMKYRTGCEHLEKKGAVIRYNHTGENIYLTGTGPDVVLFSPAVTSLDPGNPELAEAKNKGIAPVSWQNFIGGFLDGLGKKGITVSGSEGKGTTAGILTKILKGTEYDPLSILGAKLKKVNGGESSNIYTGKGSVYILEGDEYNRNFLNYHPSMNIMINFEFDHPETYADFEDYKKSFYEFFNGMKGDKTLILKSTPKIRLFVESYCIENTHKIIWFGKKEDLAGINSDNVYEICNHKINPDGNGFGLKNRDTTMEFFIPALPAYMAYNATGAIAAAAELGLSYETIKKNVTTFTGMERRFDVYRTPAGGVFITDYGHSPESIRHITGEIKTIFPGKKLHLVFQPHLFSRTYNFFSDFVNALNKSDRLSLIDIYPAREKEGDWKNKISSEMLCDELKKTNEDAFYAGKSKDMHDTLKGRINEGDVTCFIGAGDMNLYYGKILKDFNASN